MLYCTNAASQFMRYDKTILYTAPKSKGHTNQKHL